MIDVVVRIMESRPDSKGGSHDPRAGVPLMRHVQWGIGKQGNQSH